MRIRIKKGLDIPVGGVPEPVVGEGSSVRTVAVLGRDYVGLKPRIHVREGDGVRLGEALFSDKRDSAVKYTAPGAGTIIAVNRGHRRALRSIVIDLDESNDTGPDFSHLVGAEPENEATDTIRSALFDSGLWTAFRTRPFGKVPQSDSCPRSIFVTAIDTQPLAANPVVVIAGNEESFRYGLRVLEKLTDGPLYLCTGPDWALDVGVRGKVRQVAFVGPHPAGLPGTHIHHLDPVGSDRTVWNIGYQDVIAIGRLFSEGELRVDRTVALGGPGFKRPRLVTARLGANIDELTAGGLEPKGVVQQPTRLVSGSILSGRTAAGAEAFLGRYHLQISAIRECGERRLFGWSGLSARSYTAAGLFRHWQRRTGTRSFSTALHGRRTALVPVESFEHILPMNMLPVPLLRALLVKDTDQAQALGCLELDDEDLALCSYVCPGKNDYGVVLRANLEHIEREG